MATKKTTAATHSETRRATLTMTVTWDVANGVTVKDIIEYVDDLVSKARETGTCDEPSLFLPEMKVSL